jgi:hypothetical protein
MQDQRIENQSVSSLSDEHVDSAVLGLLPMRQQVSLVATARQS